LSKEELAAGARGKKSEPAAAAPAKPEEKKPAEQK
jgi:hypothetical protein